MNPSTFDLTDRRHASRVLRRHGVGKADRTELLNEISSEIAGAAADGKEPGAVLGLDKDRELIAWAEELGITGHAAQLSKVVASVLVATITAIALALIGAFARPMPGQLVIGIYLCSAVICVAGTTGLTARWLGHCSDRHVRETVRWILFTLPGGGIAAAIAGWLIARALAYRLDGTTIAAVLVVVTLVLAASAAAARFAALQGTRPPVVVAT